MREMVIVDIHVALFVLDSNMFNVLHDREDELISSQRSSRMYPHRSSLDDDDDDDNNNICKSFGTFSLPPTGNVSCE